MSLSDHVRILGRGQGRARALTRDEAQAAMTLMLRDDAPPEAVGAILMLERMKGETAEEIAGFAAAAQAGLPPLPTADLDWPSYAAGRTRGAPWFLRSAVAVARAGHRVVLHGWNGTDATVRQGLKDSGIRVATDPDQAGRILDADSIVYLPLEHLHPGLLRLVSLREVLGLRSCMNTVCRMLNPTRARASVQGVFHPSYRQLQADAAALMGLRDLTVIKGGGGEFERNPAKEILAFGRRAGLRWEQTMPALIDENRRLVETGQGDTGQGETGQVSPTLRRITAPPDRFESALIRGTTEAALATLSGHPARGPQPDKEVLH